MTERVLIDTGPLVAIFSEDDEHHDRCSDSLGGPHPSALHLLAGRHRSGLAPPQAADTVLKLVRGLSTADCSPCCRSTPTTCPPSPP